MLSILGTILLLSIIDMIQLCLEIQPTFCIHNSAITGTTYSTSYVGQGYESRIIGCSNPLTILSLCIFIVSGGSNFCSYDQLIISSYDEVSKLFLGERNCQGCSSGLNFSLASKIKRTPHHLTSSLMSYKNEMAMFSG